MYCSDICVNQGASVKIETNYSNEKVLSARRKFISQLWNKNIGQNNKSSFTQFQKFCFNLIIVFQKKRFLTQIELAKFHFFYKSPKITNIEKFIYFVKTVSKSFQPDHYN